MNIRKSIPENVEAYIAASEPGARPLLEEMRAIIKKTIPAVDESIRWAVPFYMYKGMVGGLSAFKNHVDFGLVTSLDAAVKEELAKQGYKSGVKTIQIRFDQKVPAAILKKILIAQVKANETKEAAKAKR